MTNRSSTADLAKREADAVSSVVHDLVDEREAFLAFIRGRVRSNADAEDIFQQALLRAAKYATNVRDQEKARAWFFQILRRVIADDHAQWALRETKLAVLASEMEEASPEEVAVCACSLGQLDRIRSEYAEILRRVDIDDEPLPSVALALGITVNNATVRLHRARSALRGQLRAFCGTESIRACLDCDCDA